MAMTAFTPGPKGPPSPGETLLFAASSLICFFCLCVLVWWLLRACVLGDAAGLRWRGLGGWKRVRWNEVSDFYEKLSVRNRSRAPSAAGCILEVASRKIRFSRDWSNAEALRELVAQNAINSRAAGWEVKGTRVVDPWPRAFDYNTVENRWTPRLWLKLFAIFVVYVVIQPALELVVTAHLVGWAAALGVAGAYVLLFGSMGLIFLVPLAQYRATNERKAERVTADLDGIVFEDGVRRVEAAWPDVTGYRMVSHGLLFRYVVETRQGNFDFLSSLGDARLLQAIIQRSASLAENREWRLPADEEALSGEAARWSSGRVGVGTRIFHYRTRGYRAILLGMAVLGIVCGLLFAGIALGWLPSTLPPSPAGMAVAGVFWGVGLILGWQAYRQNGVVLDDNGLTQRTLLGSRFIAWEQVQEYAVTPLGGGKVSGRGTTIGFGRDIVGYAELNEEVDRHAISSVKRRTKTVKLSS